jgi:dienelactone hydrolase
VVLVHGSGPNDMDETLYENKPFRDLAEYLSANGIAVIRYNKRTLTYGAELVQQHGKALTVYEETVEDAILAAAILKADPRVDSSRLFILGHSMGGMLAPRIHAEGGDFAGIISFAGSPRSIHDISYDQQMAYVEAMPEGAEKNEALSLLNKENYDAQVAGILNLSDEEAQNTPMSGGISAYYYKDWDKISTADYVKDISVPFLILQGSDDFQIFADKDYTAWQELLGGRSNVTFKLYTGLNHLFMKSAAGDISNIEAEYKTVKYVDEQVLADIAEWIFSPE